MAKFLLMGLPATGKTTTLKACVDILKKQSINCRLISTDSLINTRIKSEDSVIQQYEKDHGLKISPDIFTADDPSRAFLTAYGEAALSDLEERFLVDTITSSDEKDWFDFGARALLLPGVIKAIEAKKIVPVFLYAEHETILERLEKEDGWKQRPTYANAATNSSDGQGWKNNAEFHRKTRLEKYVELAKIIVSVEKTDSDLSVSYKTPEEIVQEIFEKIKALELATLNNNQFSQSCTKFFESKPSEKFLGEQQLQDTKEYLEKNLKFRGMNG